MAVTPNKDKLKFVTPTKFMGERPIMVIQDCPLDLETKTGRGYSSPSASGIFRMLNKQGIRRTQVHPTYLFNFRPPKGSINSLFYKAGLPISEYRVWPEGKNTFLLDIAYTELQRLRDEIKQVKPQLIILLGKWSLYFLPGLETPAKYIKSDYGMLLKYRASYEKLTSWWDIAETLPDTIAIPILKPQSLFALSDKTYLIEKDYIRLKLLGTALREGSFNRITKPEKSYTISPTFTQAQDTLLMLLEKLEQDKLLLSIDVETHSGYQDCVGIAWSQTEAICIPFSTLESPHYWTTTEEIEIVYLLQLVFLHKNAQHIGQNYSYDMQYFVRDYCTYVVPTYDTLTMQHTLLPGSEKSLDVLASLYCIYYKYWKDDGKTHKGATDENRWFYNCDDCCITYEVAMRLRVMYENAPESVNKAYEFQQYHAQPNVVKLMYRGVRVNKELKAQQYEDFSEIVVHLKEEFQDVMGEPINPGSSQQMQKVMYDLFQMPKQYDPKTKRLTVGKLAMLELKSLEPALAGFIDLYLEYQGLAKFTNTFLAAGLDIDDRMRTQYNVNGTDTFRLASKQNAFGSGMNMQNVPAGGRTSSGRELPNIKKLFLADEGYEMFDSDFDSADLRIVVAESGAKHLQQMMDDGKKVYIELMRDYYRDQTLDKTSKHYRTFKAIAHGSHYQGSAKGLAERTGLLVHEVDKLQKDYFAMNPEIQQWHRRLAKEVKGRGWIENIFGYRKYFLNPKLPTLMQVATAWIPQSSIGILVNKGMDNLMRDHPDIEVLLQVHDSLVGQYLENRTGAREAIISSMEIELPYPEPITIPVDMVTGSTWADCK